MRLSYKTNFFRSDSSLLFCSVAVWSGLFELEKLEKLEYLELMLLTSTTLRFSDYGVSGRLVSPLFVLGLIWETEDHGL